MTCAEVAIYFHVSERTIDRWAVEEGLPVHRVGGGQKPRKRYYRTELDTWARSRCSVPGDVA
jgi:excisionase family DNA binding protein